MMPTNRLEIPGRVLNPDFIARAERNPTRTTIHEARKLAKLDNWFRNWVFGFDTDLSHLTRCSLTREANHAAANLSNLRVPPDKWLEIED